MGGSATARAWEYWEEEDDSFDENDSGGPEFEEETYSDPPSRYSTGILDAPVKTYARQFSFQEQAEEYEDYPEWQPETGKYSREWQHYDASGQYSLPDVASMPYLFAEAARPKPALSLKFPPLLDYALDYLPRLKNRNLFMLLATVVVGWFILTNIISFVTGLAGGTGKLVSFGAGTSANINGSGATGTHSILGGPSISASKIDAVLSSYASPATGTGNFIYQQGLKYGIDPAYALAFFIHESTAGTKGVATVTKSIGNIRATAGYDSYQGFRKYPTWEAGIEDWFKLIKDLYINGWKLTTVESIVPVYAPAADRNNPPLYIKQVNDLVASWR